MSKIAAVLMVMLFSAQAQAGLRESIVAAANSNPWGIEPTTKELVCHDGKVYIELCWGEEGGRPCTLASPVVLDADFVKRNKGWSGCGNMSVLGTVKWLALAHGADAVSTGFATEVGGVEVNKVLGPDANPLKVFGVKIAVIAAGTATIHGIEKKNPGLARVVRGIMIVGLAGVSAHNFKVWADLKNRGQ